MPPRTTKERLAALGAETEDEVGSLETDETVGDTKEPAPGKSGPPALKKPEPRPKGKAKDDENFRVVNAEGEVVRAWPFGYDDSTIAQKQEVVNFFKDKFLSGWALLPEDPRTTFDRRKEEAKRKKREDVLI